MGVRMSTFSGVSTIPGLCTTVLRTCVDLVILGWARSSFGMQSLNILIGSPVSAANEACTQFYLGRTGKDAVCSDDFC